MTYYIERDLSPEIPPGGAEALRRANWRRDEDEPYFRRLFLTRLDQPQPLAVRPQIRELAAAVARHPFVQ